MRNRWESTCRQTGPRRFLRITSDRAVIREARTSLGVAPWRVCLRDQYRIFAVVEERVFDLHDLQPRCTRVISPAVGVFRENSAEEAETPRFGKPVWRQVSIGARLRSTTGISATERCNTVVSLADYELVAMDFLRPGHLFPLVAKDGGVLERDGHTEAAVDPCRLGHLSPVGVICELANDDGLL